MYLHSDGPHKSHTLRLYWIPFSIIRISISNATTFISIQGCIHFSPRSCTDDDQRVGRLRKSPLKGLSHVLHRKSDSLFFELFRVSPTLTGAPAYFLYCFTARSNKKSLRHPLMCSVSLLCRARSAWGQDKTSKQPIWGSCLKCPADIWSTSNSVPLTSHWWYLWINVVCIM